MAMLIKNFFETTSPANMASIDSLEAAYNAKFQSEADAVKIQNAIDYGHKVATAIFAWSATDGAHQAYSHIVDPTYTPPPGAGLWVPTFPTFGPSHTSALGKNPQLHCQYCSIYPTGCSYPIFGNS